MRFITTLLVGLAIAAPALAQLPTFEVLACPKKNSITYDKSVPDKTHFPKTQVDMCYDTKTICITFTAFEEKYFFYNESYTTNDPIWQYEVMETFIAPVTNDPSTYLEFEIAPNNVTFQASIYNPSKVRTEGAAFDTGFWNDTAIDGFTAETTVHKPNHTWSSVVNIPLAFFNVDNGKAQGTHWRMNFFRTVVNPKTFPKQTLGAWNPPDQPSFHMTPFFGNVKFI